MGRLKVVIQGIAGSFHYQAAQTYFNSANLDLVSTDSFLSLAENLKDDTSIDFGLMAIENSIAGSIIQNYKILRENRFRIVGELYLPIRHNLMALSGTSIENIIEVHSHPMALNQCVKFLKQYPDLKWVRSKDTASSAKQISEEKIKNRAAIASESAAKLYKLDILAEGIETSKVNYTRFVILQRDDRTVPEGQFDKASIYIRTPHKKGSLLKVLQKIYEADINLSKLQSYPIEGDLNQYYFYLDLEFDHLKQYEKVISELDQVTQHLEVLGVYKRG